MRGWLVQMKFKIGCKLRRKSSSNYLLQYSATGALFYIFYENGREQFIVDDSLLPAGGFRSKKEVACVLSDDFLRIGMSRQRRIRQWIRKGW